MDKVAWGRVVSDKHGSQFKDEVLRLSNRIQTSADHLLSTMAFETGETFSPSTRNNRSGAVGLIQFLPSTATDLGTSSIALSRMTATDQLAYVELYFLPYTGRINSLDDLYMAILWPAAIGKAGSLTLFEQGSRAYINNRGLDKNADGKITRDEACEGVRRLLQKGSEPDNAG